MDQHNIDRLFREKLDAFEVTPSPGSWTSVEKEISSVKSKMIYWVAASVTLLATLWFVWQDPASSTDSRMISNIDHPQLPTFSEPSAPIAAALSEEQKQPRKAIKASASPEVIRQQTAVLTEVVEKAAAKPEKEAFEIELIETKDVALETFEIDPINEQDQVAPVMGQEASSRVKITYIAANTENIVVPNQLKDDSTGAIKKFFAFAEKIDPGEMLADIKTAKDNLLNGGLKTKKERSAMNP